MADRLAFPDTTARIFRGASWSAAVDVRDRWQDYFRRIKIYYQTYKSNIQSFHHRDNGI